VSGPYRTPAEREQPRARKRGPWLVPIAIVVLGNWLGQSLLIWIGDVPGALVLLPFPISLVLGWYVRRKLAR